MTRLILLSLLFSVGSSINLKANRGDIVSYEYLGNFQPEEVVEYGLNVAGGFLDNNSDLEGIMRLFFSSVIDQRELDVYKVVYESVDFYDNPVQASGAVIIPKHEDFVCEKSFSLYGHGTRFNREGVFSRTSGWGSEFFLPLLMASINTVCVAPDYYGMGDGDGFHHHNTFKTNATSSIDALRAGRNLCDILGVPYNNRLLPMGYSEGGTNAMGVAKMIHEEGLQNEFDIRLLGAGSGAYDLSGEAYNFIMTDPYYATRQYILYLIASCEDIYGNLIDEEAGESVSTYLVSPYDQLYEDNILTQNGNYYWVAENWPTMFKPEALQAVLDNPNHPFRVCLKNSNVYDWQNPYWTFLYYCTTDEQVPPSGSLKTRDVQRSHIPWWQFWDRFKIQALDLTLGDAIPNHSTCALPSIVVELFFMQFNLGLSCEYTGREADALKLETLSGERVANELIYSTKDIDFKNMKIEKDLKSIEVFNLQSAERISSESNARMQIKEPGLYLIAMERNNGEQIFNWLFKMAPDYVNTLDYDPILTNPMNQTSQLDLSLLEEEVQQVAIIDKNGNEHAVINNGLQQNQIALQRVPSMVDGEYTVEVRTEKFTYPLLLKVNSSVKDNLLEVFPNPTSKQIKINIGYEPTDNVSLKVYDIKGNQVLVETINTSQELIDVQSLANGFYTVEVDDNGARFKTSFVKQ